MWTALALAVAVMGVVLRRMHYPVPESARHQFPIQKGNPQP